MGTDISFDCRTVLMENAADKCDVRLVSFIHRAGKPLLLATSRDCTGALHLAFLF